MRDNIMHPCKKGLLHTGSVLALSVAVPSGDGEREVAFAPAHDTGTLTVYGVLEAVEASGQTTVDLARNAELTRIDRELENLKETARKSQDNVRLVDLL